VLLTACGGNEEKKELVRPIKPIKYSKIVAVGSDVGQEYSGAVQSSKETHLSFKVNGSLNQLPVKVGDKVRKGQLLARIDATDYQIQAEQSTSSLLSAQTQIKSAESQLLNAKATYERIEKLYENNSVSLSDFEQAKSALETAEASFQAAKAQAGASEKQLEASRNQVSYSRLTAPFDGVITALNAEENEFIVAGNPIATLNSEAKPEVSVGLPEGVIAKVKKGQKVDIHFSALANQDFIGSVSEVGYSNNGGSTYPVIIQIENASDAIRPGMAARVNFKFNQVSESDSKKLVVPVAAVGQDTQGKFVFVLKPNEDHYLVERKAIDIGELGGQGFELKQGLQAGDIVATSGLQSLIVGMKVKLME
jgi:RND family efflux transporter MFP subunit